jgi:hypothetical protein
MGLPTLSTLKITVLFRKNQQVAGEPPIECFVCKRQRPYAGRARFEITPIEVDEGNVTEAAEGNEMEVPLCSICIARIDLDDLLMRSFGPNVEVIDGRGDTSDLN